MRTYTFSCELWLPRPIAEVFAFFSDAGNLERLTPPWLNFQILTPRPIAMAVGTRIQYKLHIHGVPVRWESEISAWRPTYFLLTIRFADLVAGGTMNIRS